jgi:hypothetical protein
MATEHFDLGTLLNPLSVDEFFADYWEKPALTSIDC